MNSPLLIGLAHHLWQSTLFAGAIGLLALVFRRNRASLRHALWLVASLKFLLPFALLTAIAGRIPLSAFWHSAQRGVAGNVASMPSFPPQWIAALDSVAAPLAPSHAAPVAAAVVAQPASISVWMIVALVWALGAVAVIAFWCARWV